MAASKAPAGALPVPSFNAQLEERSVVGYALSADGGAAAAAGMVTEDDVARLRDASLLCVVFDTNRAAWAGPAEFAACADAIVAFCAAFRLIHPDNTLAFVLARRGASRLVVAPAGEADAQAPIAKMRAQLDAALAQATLEGGARESWGSDLAGAGGTAAATPPSNGIAAGLSQALCFVNRVAVQAERRQKSVAGGGGVRCAPRILAVVRSRDDPAQYVQIMNCIFSAQARGMPVDALVLRRRMGVLGDGGGAGASAAASAAAAAGGRGGAGGGVGAGATVGASGEDARSAADSGFFQQGTALTGGTYLRLNPPLPRGGGGGRKGGAKQEEEQKPSSSSSSSSSSSLLQYLLSVFLPDRYSRGKLVAMSNELETVDFRATDFATGRCVSRNEMHPLSSALPLTPAEQKAPRDRLRLQRLPLRLWRGEQAAMPDLRRRAAEEEGPRQARREEEEKEEKEGRRRWWRQRRGVEEEEGSEQLKS